MSINRKYDQNQESRYLIDEANPLESNIEIVKD